MKLHIISKPEQAHAALSDYKGQKVSYVTTNLLFKGVLRHDKKKDQFYIKGKTERIDLKLVDIHMIVNRNEEIKIITSL